MSNYLEALNLDLDASSEAGQHRRTALESTPWAPTPTTNVSYVAANRLLIIASLEAAREIESRLPDKILCYIVAPFGKSTSSSEANIYHCADIGISGFLGRYEALVNPDSDGNADDGNLASIFSIESGLFDQVLDCSDSPLIEAAIKPPGYYFAGGDEVAVDLAIESIPELIGEFEKPKYFNYDPGICSHGRSGIKGCNRCIDACPTDAIISIGESIEVNPHLCQGGGSCTSSCPTGAITYAYPKADEQIDFLRILLKSLRDLNGNKSLTLLVFDNEHGRESVEAFAPQLDDGVIPLLVEEIGSVGLDLVAAALAFGANRVFLYVPEDVPAQVRVALQHNLSIVKAVIDQTGSDQYRAEIIDDLDTLRQDDSTESEIKAATFGAVGNKRNTIRTALGWFAEISQDPPEYAALPENSLFGQVHLDSDGCTLCMGCVSVCPGNALQAGGDTPALKFIEANCVQCGICTRACPESVMTLEPRLHFDYETVTRTRVLKDEQPFLCISCGKPFATKAMITRMTNKLQGHWMFDKPEAMDRLKMCEDCRVKDLFDKEDEIAE